MNNSVLLDDPESNEQQEEPEEEAKSSYHIGCFLLTLLNLFALTLLFDVAFALGIIYPTENITPSTEDGTEVLCWFFGITYFFYLLNCLISKTARFLWQNMEILDYETLVEKIKASKPALGIKVQCWHLHKGTRGVYSLDAQGNAIVRQEPYQEQVITHKAFHSFSFGSWKDVSGDLSEVMKGRHSVRLKVKAGYLFGDDKIAQRFEEERAKFIRENQKKDKYLDESITLDIAGLREKVMVKEKGFSFLSYGWFWFWSLLLLSWPYRRFVDRCSPKKKIMIKKALYS